MNLMYRPLNLNINLDDSVLNEICIEKSEVFSEVLSELWRQATGGDGNFNMYEAEKEYAINKATEVIINPFELTCNNRKIINAIYRELEEIANDDYFEQTAMLNTDIVRHLSEVAQKLPYPIRFDTDLNKTGLYSLYNLKIDEASDTLVNKFVSYIKLMHQVCGIKYFIFINIRQFLSLKELCDLVKACTYEEIHLVNIEGKSELEVIENENISIIDKDLCIIFSEES